MLHVLRTWLFFQYSEHINLKVDERHAKITHEGKVNRREMRLNNLFWKISKSPNVHFKRDVSVISLCSCNYFVKPFKLSVASCFNFERHILSDSHKEHQPALCPHFCLHCPLLLRVSLSFILNNTSHPTLPSFSTLLLPPTL